MPDTRIVLTGLWVAVMLTYLRGSLLLTLWGLTAIATLIMASIAIGGK